MRKLTPAQFKALWAAFKKPSASYMRGSGMGGAQRRMFGRLAADGLLTNNWTRTDKGMKTLRDACHERWAKSGCMAHQEDLQEVEKALKNA